MNLPPREVLKARRARPVAPQASKPPRTRQDAPLQIVLDTDAGGVYIGGCEDS